MCQDSISVQKFKKISEKTFKDYYLEMPISERYNRFEPQGSYVDDFFDNTKSDSLNIKKMQSIIVFTGGLKISFDGLIAVFYRKCKFNGESKSEAFMSTLDMIADKMKIFLK